MAALGTRKLTLSVGGSDITAEVSKAVITSEESDSDFISFADAAAGGGRTYKLVITAVQDLASGSFWRQVWDNAGEDVAFILAPYGGAAGAGTPHVVGTCTIVEPDGDFIGSEADASTTSRAIIEVEFPCLAKPTFDTTP